MSLLKELFELMVECEDCEIVYVDESDNVLEEAAKRAYSRRGGKVVKKYRCTSGMKKGKIVSDPKTCVQRKDPKKKRLGKKIAREKKGIRIRKSKITKRTASSKLVSRMNKRLSGK